MLLGDPYERVVHSTPKGITTHKLRTTALEVFPLTESGVPHLARLVVSMLQGSTCIPAPSLSWCYKRALCWA